MLPVGCAPLKIRFMLAYPAPLSDSDEQNIPRQRDDDSEHHAKRAREEREEQDDETVLLYGFDGRAETFGQDARENFAAVERRNREQVEDRQPDVHLEE